MANIDDLTIYLKMIDKTKQATDSATKNINKVKLAIGIAAAAASALAVAIGASLKAAISNGSEISSQILQISNQTSTATSEVSALYRTLSEAVPTITLDNVNDILIDLSERIADARAGTGPLQGLLDSYGEAFKDFDLSIEGSRAQLSQFIRAVSNIEGTSGKILALQEVFGDSARSILPLIENTEELDDVYRQLESTITDVNGELSRQEDADRAIKSGQELSVSWNNFSKTMYELVAPGIEQVNTWLIEVVESASEAAIKVDSFFSRAADSFTRIFQNEGANGASGAGYLIGTSAADGFYNGFANNIEIPPIPTVPKVERVTLPSIPGKTPRETAEQKARRELLDLEDSVRAARASGELSSLQSLDAANSSRFNEPDLANSTASFDRSAAQAEKLGAAITGIGNALGFAGSAFGAFADSAEANGSKSFETYKKLSIAISTVAGVTAALGALAAVDNPTFVQKLAAYAQVTAIVASGLATIKSTSIGSAGGSSTATGGSSTIATGPTGGTADTTGTDTTQQKNVVINIQGNGNYTADQIEELIDAINDNDLSSKISSNRIAA